MGVIPDDKRALLNQAQKDGVVLGLQKVTGETIDRMDIDKLLHEQPDAFNVFLISLKNLQDQQADGKMTYFQVAGIHGLPLKVWDNDTGGLKNNMTNVIDESGYCHHGHLGFGPWHRPYLAMIEQTIFHEMINVAEKYPENKRQKYFDAVRKWRLPYWDYYRPRGGAVSFPGVDETGEITTFAYDCGAPTILTIPQVMVRTTEKDELEPLANPLVTFHFPQQHGLSSDDWATMENRPTDPSQPINTSQTTRHPIKTKPQSLRESFEDFNKRYHDDSIPVNLQDPLNKRINGVRENTLKLLSQMFNDPVYADVEDFGTAAQTTRASGSLEGIHGDYHMFIGGKAGHMSMVPIAAFDPVFWIHHCQIDRLFTIWQKAHPQSWFPTDNATIKKFTDRKLWFDPDKALLPFRTQSKGQFWDYWTCNSSKETATFGYRYPDTPEKAAPADVLKTFRDNYSWSYRVDEIRPDFGKCPKDMLPLNMRTAQVYQFTEEVLKKFDPVQKAVVEHAAKSASVAPTKQVKEPVVNPSERAFTNSSPDELADPKIDDKKLSHSWYIDMLVERLALDGSFAAQYFLGDFDDDPAKYDYQPTLAATNSVFAAPTEACDNCGHQDEQALLVTDTTDITPMLLDFKKTNQLVDLSREHVVPFLKERLKWRVVTAHGVQVNPRSIPSLKMGISARLVPVPPATGEPMYQEFPEVIEHIIANSS